MARRNGASGQAPVAHLEDHVDRLLREWSTVQSDLDVTPIAVVYRLTRLAAEWNSEIERVFARARMTSTDFAVLANLRRAGDPYQLTQRRIMNALRLTSGTVSLRIDKLVDRGFVERHPDPTDARASLVTLTPAGSAMFDAVAPEHLANESRLVAALSPEEQTTMARLLKVLLVEVEQPAAARPDHRVGMTVAAAPVAQQRRAAVGLPPASGLLVDDVLAGGAADRAGVRRGDFITSSGDTPLRSLVCLEGALGMQVSVLPLSLIRNGRRHIVELPIDELGARSVGNRD